MISEALNIVFLFPWLLLGLLALPILWWLLRSMPPRPQIIGFPATKFLLDLVDNAKTAYLMPLWLLIFRLLLAATLIIAFAEPILNPNQISVPENSRAAILIDNDWANAENWDHIKQTAKQLIEQEELNANLILLIPTAQATTENFSLLAPGDALNRLEAIKPQPYLIDRTALTEPLQKSLAEHNIKRLFYLSNGLGLQQKDNQSNLNKSADDLTTLSQKTDQPFFDMLENVGLQTLDIYAFSQQKILISHAQNFPASLDITLIAHNISSSIESKLIFKDNQNQIIAEKNFELGSMDEKKVIQLNLPVELRNQIMRIEVAGHNHAGAVFLLDQSSIRKKIAIFSGETKQNRQPILDPLHYLENALSPTAQIINPIQLDMDTLSHLQQQNIAMIILSDVGILEPDIVTQLRNWIEAGGVLIRFSGPRMAALLDRRFQRSNQSDLLLPTELYYGDRQLGGVMSWGQPLILHSFSKQSPFSHINIEPNITVSRQILAKPGPELKNNIWASLEDGTPLVTGKRIGLGFSVLFHVTADLSWSNLPITGTFIDMITQLAYLEVNNVVHLQSGRIKTETNALTPSRIIDANGHWQQPNSDNKVIIKAKKEDRDKIEDTYSQVSQRARHAYLTKQASRDYPPGIYESETQTIALNTLTDAVSLMDVRNMVSAENAPQNYPQAQDINLKPYLLILAVFLFILDFIATLFLQNAFTRHRLEGSLKSFGRPLSKENLTLIFVLSLIFISFDHQNVVAQSISNNDQAKESQLLEKDLSTHTDILSQTRIAYIKTGIPATDLKSYQGLLGLSVVLSRRTSVEPGEPIGLTLGKDDPSFYTLIYWPIRDEMPTLSARQIDAANAYMANGGTILFDTQDQLLAINGSSTSHFERLKHLLRRLNIPAIEIAPPQHIVSKTFYLLDDFPGRYQGGAFWTEVLPQLGEGEEGPVHAGDNVSPILVTSNDLAGAWAINDQFQYVYNTYPNTPKQRELAFRVGINIMMYTLTGNYKADQVHLPAIIDRLGH